MSRRRLARHYPLLVVEGGGNLVLLTNASHTTNAQNSPACLATPDSGVGQYFVCADRAFVLSVCDIFMCSRLRCLGLADFGISGGGRGLDFGIGGVELERQLAGQGRTQEHHQQESLR